MAKTGVNFGFKKLYPEGTPVLAGTERRCPKCRKWYKARLSSCSECGADKPAFNPYLRRAMLDNHLNAQKEYALKNH